MDDQDDWRERQIEAFESAYKRATPCAGFYPADECGKLFKDWCLECGWDIESHNGSVECDKDDDDGAGDSAQDVGVKEKGLDGNAQ